MCKKIHRFASKGTSPTKSMRSSIRLKVACGYAVTAVLLIVAITYVYDCSSLLIDKSDIERWQEHRKTTDEFISKLFDAETMASTAAIGGKEALSVYNRSVQEALGAIATMDSVATDSLQHARLDSLAGMILEKQRVIGLLANMIKDDDEMLNYYRQLDKIIKENDTITTSRQTIVQVVNEQTSSYVVNEPKKNIFKRIANVFNPGHADTLTVSNDVNLVKTDTLTRVDNSAGRLSGAYDSINNERLESSIRRINSINRQTDNLRYASVELGLKVSQLIKMISDEERANQDAAMEKDYQTRKKAATNTVIIAVVAIILAITFFIMTWRDVARSNRYRRELETAKKRAEELLEARQRLMLTITHDIKAPVGGILGHLELMEGAGEQERGNCIKSIRDSSSHLLALVNSLLDYHRLDLEKMDVQLEKFNPAELIRAICESFEPAARKKGLELRREILESADCDCKSDTFHIRQIVENLMSNALKFTEEGFIAVKAYIISDMLYISVSDSGCGMDEEEKQLIFKELTRLGGARGTAGVGVGMSISSKQAKHMKQNIEVSGEKGRGTTFNVTIPMHAVQSEDEESPAAVEVERFLEILLIDDDPIQLNLTASMLHKLDGTWRVECCDNPDEALEKINARKFDVVFTDIQMPGTDGFELLGLIRQASAEIPVIAVTARSGMEGEGFSAILYKPYSLADIRAVLSEIAPPKAVDLSALTAFAADDPQAGREILQTFLEETLKNKESLEAAVSASDLEEASRIAHKMLPTFTMIGAPMLNAFKELELRRGGSLWLEEDSRLAAKALESMEAVLAELQKAVG